MESIIPLLGEKYIFDILKALGEGPKRYIDLKKECPNDTTRTMKIRKLKDADLIVAEAGEEGKRSVIRFRLTEKGGNVLEQLNALDIE